MGVIRKTRTKILNITTVLILVANGLGAALPLSLAGTAYADSDNGGRVINSANLPSGGSTIVNLPVTASVNVTTSGGDDNFECIAWAIATSQPDNASFTAYDFAPNHTTSGTYDEQVIMTAPSNVGTYNAYFIAYGNNSCTGNGSNVYTLSNAITVTDPFNFNFTPSTPSATPAAGTYASTQNVTLSSSGLFTPINIYYTTDGSTPDCTPTGTAYTSPISVSTSEAIKAIACDALKQASSVSTFDYTINSAPPAAPTPTGFTQSGGRTLTCGAVTNASHINSTSLGWTLPTGETETAWRVIPTYPSGSHGTPYSWTSGTSVWIGANIGQGYGAAPNDQGLYQYSIQYKNANGVWSDPATCNLTYDSVAPTIDILSPAANNFVHGTATVRAKITENGSGVKSVDAKFTDGSSHGATPNEFGTVALHLVAGTTDTYEGQIDTTGHSGVYNVAVDAWDNANNSRSAKNQNVTIDNTAPTTPTITGFTSPTLACGDATNAYVGGIAIHWTLSNALSSIYQYAITPSYPDNHGEYTYYPSGSTTSTWIGDNFGRHGDGVYSYTIKAQSKSGLWSGPSTTCTLTYDAHAPSVSVVSPAASEVIGGLGNDYKVTVKLKIDDLTGVDTNPTYTWVEFYDGSAVNGSVSDHSKKYELHQVGSSDIYTADIDTTDFVAALHNSGTYSLAVRAKDMLGNASSHDFYYRNASDKLLVDNNRPTVSITSPGNNTYQQGSFTITGTASDKETSIDHVSIYVAHNPWSAGGYEVKDQPATFDPSTGKFIYDVSNLPEGTYSVKAFAYDQNGNVQSVGSTITVDNTLPTVKVNLDRTSYLTNGGTTGKVQDPEIEAYDTNLTEIQIVDQNGKEVTHWGNGKSSVTPGTVTRKNISWLGEGTYTIYAYDAANNKSAGFTLTIDNTAPSVPTGLSWLDSNSNPATNGFTNTQKGVLSWQDSTHTDVNNYVYKFWTNIPGYFDGEANAWTTDSSSYITKTATGGSIWTDFYNDEGTYYFCVEAVDAVGNPSACSDTYTVTYDKTAPDAPVASPVGGDFQSSPTVTLAADDNTGGSGIASIWYTTDGSTPSSTNGTEYALDNSSPIVPSSSQPNGQTVIKAVAYDQAGNPSSVMTETYNVAPTITEGSITPTTSTIIIVWTTDHSATSRVVYDTTSHSDSYVQAHNSSDNYGYANSVDNGSTKTLNHSVTLTGLTPGTTYYFRLVSEGSPEAVSTEFSSVTLDKKLTKQNNGTPTFVATTTQNGNNGNVLGAQTTTPNTPDNSKTDGQVQGDQTTNQNTDNNKDKKVSHSNFLGLGWWWLLVLAVILAFLWYVFGRADSDDKKA